MVSPDGENLDQMVFNRDLEPFPNWEPLPIKNCLFLSVCNKPNPGRIPPMVSAVLKDQQ